MFISPTGEFPQYSGDIERSHKGWTEDKPLPSGWVKVTNDIPPASFFIWAEFEEGQNEDNTAPINETIYKPTLDESKSAVVWVPVTVKFVQEPDHKHPHQLTND
tara:strand:+ start:2754 stop:3065 length:312 start_codon:yes stop_codon:yes gene_type:complete